MNSKILRRLDKPTNHKETKQHMKRATLEQATDLLEVMTITQSIDNGPAITHHGHIEGVPTIIISTCRGNGDCYVIQ
jgi:hypothetical protein